VATLALVAWGALAFGAVYPWAFMPMFAGCAVAGTAALLQRPVSSKTDLTLALSLVAVLIAIGVQLVPLRVSTLRLISPETDTVLQRFEIGYPPPGERHALSIQPRATAVALMGATALSLFLCGLVRSLTRDNTQLIIRGVTVLGVVLAVVGMAQKAMWNGKIYGFWTPIGAAPGAFSPFGPFVNKNHFAGWILMALPLAIGYLCGRVARGTRGGRPGLRNRIIWLSSAEASETMLVAFAVVVMALALMLTLSRSGMIGLLVALVISGWFVARRQRGGARRAAVIGYLVFIGIAAAAWTGLDRIAARFAEGSTGVAGDRFEIWADAWRIARRFFFAGTGLNTYGTASLFYQTVDLKEHLAQAHNDYLQLLAEGGLLVCIPVAFAILALVWTVSRRFREVSPESTDYWIRVGAMTGLVAIAVQEISDFSLQMPGNAVLCVVLMALVLRQSTPSRRTATSDHTKKPEAVLT